MDDTHLEFVNLLAEVVNANDDRLMPLWQALIDHTTMRTLPTRTAG